MPDEVVQGTGNENVTKKRGSNFSFIGLVAGFVLGYIVVFALSLLLGYLLATLIYGIIFILFAWYAQDRRTGFLKWASIGSFGIVLGFLIWWMIEQGAKKNKAYKILMSVIAWFILIGVGILISAIEVHSSITTSVGSIYNFSTTTQNALCSNNITYIQNLFKKNGLTNYTVIKTYCVGSEGYVVEKHT